MEVQVKLRDGCHDLGIPKYATDGSSAVDLRAAIEEFEIIHSGETKVIQTGLFLSIPKGFEAQVRPRSGLALKNKITVMNSPGTIDSDYRGEVGVILSNFGSRDFIIKRGDRIAQLVFCPVIIATLKQVDELDETSRGDGGYGHTGV